MAIFSRRSVLAFALLGTLIIPPSVALASQMWQSTCVTCGNQSTHFTKNSPTCLRSVNNKTCGGRLVWVQVK